MRDILLNLFQACPYPEVAAVLRLRAEPILRRWSQSVSEVLPHAEELNLDELRDSLPATLEAMANALASPKAAPTRILLNDGSEHGVTRFHQGFSLHEMLTEYDLLRPILVEEVAKDLAREMTLGEVIALNSGIDLASRHSIVSYVTSQQRDLKRATDKCESLTTYIQNNLQSAKDHARHTLETVTDKMMGLDIGPDLAGELKDLISDLGDIAEGMDKIGNIPAEPAPRPQPQ